MSKNLPWFKFYPRDWLTDEKLRRCCQATRCFWLEAICQMYLSDTVSLTGSCDELSRVLSCTVAEVRTAVDELRISGAAEIDERNSNITLTSRRRVKECQIRDLRSFAGNVSATKRKQESSGNEFVSVSDSDSFFGSGNGDARGKGAGGDAPYTPDAEGIPDSLKTPEFLAAWPQWVAHRARKKSTLLNCRSAQMQLKQLAAIGPERAVAAIEHSVAGGYQGIFEPKSNGAVKTKATGVSAETISAIAARVTGGNYAR